MSLHDDRLQQGWVVKIAYESIVGGRYTQL